MSPNSSDRVRGRAPFQRWEVPCRPEKPGTTGGRNRCAREPGPPERCREPGAAGLIRTVVPVRDVPGG